MEEREKKRVAFHVKAILKYGDEIIEGEVENLSITGMLLKTERDIPDTIVINISMILSGLSSKLNLNLTGQVARKSGDGIAITFVEMDLDTYVHLKNIISLNQMDDGKIIKEFEDAFNGNSVKD